MKALILDKDDSIAVVLQNVSEGEKVELVLGREVIGYLEAESEIPFGHKIAIKNVEENDHIKKYGEDIGRATRWIKKGEHVHTQNLVSIRGSS
jgi:hypothetical protein